MQKHVSVSGVFQHYTSVSSHWEQQIDVIDGQ